MPGCHIAVGMLSVSVVCDSGRLNSDLMMRVHWSNPSSCQLTSRAWEIVLSHKDSAWAKWPCTGLVAFKLP
jgi:hypothetical protein